MILKFFQLIFVSIIIAYISKAFNVLLLLVLVSCTIAPKELTKVELEESAKIDKALMFGNEEKLVGSISLEEAVARALKHNLDSRARSMEQALALNQIDLDNYFNCYSY